MGFLRLPSSRFFKFSDECEWSRWGTSRALKIKTHFRSCAQESLRSRAKSSWHVESWVGNKCRLRLRGLKKTSCESRKKTALKNTKSGSVEWWERKNTARRRVFLKTGVWSWDIDGMGFGERRAIIFG